MNNFFVENGVPVKYHRNAMNSEIEIPDDVKEIGSGAFMGNFTVKHVIIPNGVTAIGDRAFSSCYNLESIEIPDSVITIGKEAFFDCFRLKSVRIPDGVSIIMDGTFGRCSSLSDVKLSSNLRVIGSSAFSHCESLENIEIPGDVAAIGAQAFADCTSLRSVVLPRKLAEITVEMFARNKKMSTVIIPDGVTRIGRGAFWGCSALDEIQIPQGVTTIESQAFYNSGVTEVKIPDGITTINSKAFAFCTKMQNLELPDSLTLIDKEAFAYCSALKNVALPDHVQQLGKRAFFNCGELHLTCKNEDILNSYFQQDFVIQNGTLTAYNGIGGKVIVPQGVKVIGERAFYNCTGVTEIVLPSGLLYIEDEAFYGCSGLKNADGLIIVGDILFDYIGDQTSVTVPNGIKRISVGAFKDCASLTEVILPEGLEIIDNGAFYQCTGITSMVIPNSVKYIYEKAFYGCKNLKEIALSEAIEKIDRELFVGCSSLKSITIPKKVREIRSNAFRNCTALERVELSGLIKEVSSDAFDGCETFTVAIGENTIKEGGELSAIMGRYLIETTDTGYAYIMLKQRGAGWSRWQYSHAATNPVAEFDAMYSILTKEKIDKKTAKPVAWFINKYYSALDPEKIRNMLELYKGMKCKEIDELNEMRELMRHLGEEVSEESSIELLAKKIAESRPSEPEAEKIVKKGIHWKDSKELCDRNVLICILSHYIREWKRCAVEKQGEMGYATTMLQSGANVKNDPEIDQIAQALDRKELSELLTKQVNGAQYRTSLLAWARYGNEESVAEVCGKYKSKKRGTAKDRYFAENLEEALLISDTREAMLFYEHIGNLQHYASIRGMTTMELRDTMMMPDFGFDADGVKRYDIGGNTIEARVNADFGFDLFDVNKQKAIRSMPKKSDDPVKAEAAAKDFAQLKKTVKGFVKERSELLCKMHLSGETVNTDFWKKIYLQHPVIKWLGARVIWMDKAGNTFAVINGVIVDAEGNLYEPQGDVQVAHVLDMKDADISAWQKKLSEIKWEQLFEQVWEPKMKWNSSQFEKRYSNVKISNKERSALKARLKRRGVEVRSGEMEREYNGRWNTYTFLGSNTMYFGNSLEIDYAVDDGSLEVTFGSARLTNGYNSYKMKELNAILLELDKSAVCTYIENDRVELLVDGILDSFGAAQISAFAEYAISANALNCTARLLEYKNAHYPEYSEFNDFVLDW